MKEIITILISNYYSHEIVESISKYRAGAVDSKLVNRLRQEIFDDKRAKDGFGVLALNSGGDVVGILHCIQNEEEERLWYYGDLFVHPEYRRMKIATRMIETAISHFSEIDANVLRCYVDPNNEASIRLQKSVGFRQKEFKTFNDLCNEGELMFEYNIPSILNVVPATSDEAYFVRIMFVENLKYLHCENIKLNEWRELLSADDPDEEHFLICKGAMPVGYMKINGLLNENTAWISMLFISEQYHRQGIGIFAVSYAEDFIKGKGFSSIAIQTTQDNVPARTLYEKCGYSGKLDVKKQKCFFVKKL